MILRSSEPTAAAASTGTDVLVRRRLPHAAALTTTGQWATRDRPDGPVRVLTGPADIVVLAATIQHRTRSTRPEPR